MKRITATLIMAAFNSQKKTGCFKIIVRKAIDLCMMAWKDREIGQG